MSSSGARARSETASGTVSGIVAAGIDITERHEQAAARERERVFLNSIANNAPSLLCLIDHDGRLAPFASNKAFERTLEYAPEETGGNVLWERFVAPEDADDVRGVVERVIAGEALRPRDSTLADEERRPPVGLVVVHSAAADRRAPPPARQRRRRDAPQASRARAPARARRDDDGDPDRAERDRGARPGGSDPRPRRRQPAGGRQPRVPRRARLARRAARRRRVPRPRRRTTTASARRSFCGQRRTASRPARSSRSGSASDGGQVPFAWTAAPVADVTGRTDGLVLVSGMDITERRLQERELRASRQRIVTAGDEERRRLERNLHDGAQQRLVALSVALRLAESRLASGGEGVAELLVGRAGGAGTRARGAPRARAGHPSGGAQRPRARPCARGARGAHTAPRRGDAARGPPAPRGRGRDLLRRLRVDRERLQVRAGDRASGSTSSTRPGSPSCSCATTASAEPIRRAGRGCAASPTGSVRSTDGSWSSPRSAAEPSSTPRSRCGLHPCPPRRLLP